MVLPCNRRWSHRGSFIWGEMWERNEVPWRDTWSACRCNKLGSWAGEVFCIPWPHPSTTLFRSGGQGRREFGGWERWAGAVGDGEMGGAPRDTGSGAFGVWGFARKAQTVESASNFSHVRAKHKNHLNRLNLGCLTP